ncbi:MAG: PH domain-containing protein [Bulleidia sp.]|nr:PH domain-containing protein [Bulleidia sp.]
MPSVSSAVHYDSSLVNLQEIDVRQVREGVQELLIPGESIACAYQTIRDQVVFTDKRIIVVNVQGITGKKTSYMSYPYSKVQNFAVQTAGVLDIDCELLLFFVNGMALQFDFKARVDVRKISHVLANYIL